MAPTPMVPGAASAVPEDREVTDLVAAARCGDEVAFGRLYRHFAERVFRFCLFRVGRPADAEDLTQLVFLRVVEALPRFEERGTPFAAWLFRIARNVTIDFRRTHRDQAALDSVPAALEVDRRDDLLMAVEREMLLWAMDGLTRDQHDVIWFRYFADLPTSVVAVLMDRDEVTVRSLQARAIAALRRRLGGEPAGHRRLLSRNPGAVHAAPLAEVQPT